MSCALKALSLSCRAVAYIIYMCIYVYIYIYTERERHRKKEREGKKKGDSPMPSDYASTWPLRANAFQCDALVFQ